MTNQTPNSKIAAILGEKTGDGYTFMLPYDQAATQLQQLMIEAQIELLERIHCCDNEPINKGYPINVCSYEHNDLLTALKAQLNKEVDSM